MMNVSLTNQVCTTIERGHKHFGTIFQGPVTFTLDSKKSRYEDQTAGTEIPLEDA